MTHSLAVHNVYVEGDDDAAILSRWFPHVQFKASGGKDQVRRKVEQDATGYGLLDRDFASDDQVKASQSPDSRVVIMQRYTIENYLLEPAIITAAVEELGADELGDWLDEDHVRRKMHEWAEELALYTAANSIISEWRDAIMFDRQLGFLRYFGPLPPIPRAQVVTSLRQRLAALTPAEQVESVLDARYERVRADLDRWEGLQRWTHGKVLLESYLYPRVFKAAGLSKPRLRALLMSSLLWPGAVRPGKVLAFALRKRRPANGSPTGPLPSRKQWPGKRATTVMKSQALLGLTPPIRGAPTAAL